MKGERLQHYLTLDVNNKIMSNIRHFGHHLRTLPDGKGGQNRILIILKRHKGMITQRDLTERIGIKPGSMSEILAKIEAKGLIERSENEHDHRNINIQLTSQGFKEAEKAKKLCDVYYGKMLAQLSEDEKLKLCELLEKIVDVETEQ